MSQSNPLFLTIDGGGTKTKVTISTYSNHPQSQSHPPQFQILSTFTHSSSNPSDLGLNLALQSIHQATQTALSLLPKPYSISSEDQRTCPFIKIWAGLSGVDSEEDIQIVHEALSVLFNLQDPVHSNDVLKVTNDCDLLTGPIETRYLDSIQTSSHSKVFQGGIVLIAGTGSIVTAYVPKDLNDRNSNSNESSLKVIGRLGGYGYLIGDEGSAYDVGKRTIRSILEYSDTLQSNPISTSHSIISKSNLIPMILNHFGIQTVHELLHSIYKLDFSKGETEHDRKIRISEICRLVMSLAFPIKKDEKVDEFASKIIQETVEALSELLFRICQLHSLRPNHLVLSLGGGMWKDDRFKELFIDYTKETWDAQWGWVERVNEPDEMAAMSLVKRYLNTLESNSERKL
ncbi:hypothetical protein DFH28DRAFT_888004 [Melampsora americana]|nr:hypothetical protein DFH28DRAFT_888004 [Melampsora americana]